MEFKITNQKDFDNRLLLSPEIKDLWINALRSGNYQQGKKKLSVNNTFCCLGVLCEINHLAKIQVQNGFISYSYRSEYDVSILPKGFAKHLNIDTHGTFFGFTIDGLEALTVMNDQGYTFEQISEIIEQYF